MGTKRRRYPGLKPFEGDEMDSFFGREKEIEEVSRLLDLNNLLILHGLSGMGKSSLINAGIIPNLKDVCGWRTPHKIVQIRFTNYESSAKFDQLNEENKKSSEPKEVIDPIDKFIEESDVSISDWEEIILMPEKSFWLAAKKLTLANGEKPLRLVFVFDQFEELFTYPEERVEAFASLLQELYHQELPESVRVGIERGRIIHQTNNDKEKLARINPLYEKIQQPLNLKILISMRSDKLSYLERFKRFLPEMMVNSYELKQLDEKQAIQAIRKPALLPGDNFESPRFTYSPTALNEILDHLRDGAKWNIRIDPSFLQIVCQDIESKMIKKTLKTQNTQKVRQMQQTQEVEEVQDVQEETIENRNQEI